MKVEKNGPYSQAKAFRSLDGRGLVALHMKAFDRDAVAQLGGEAAVGPVMRRYIRSLARQDARCEQWYRQAAVRRALLRGRQAPAPVDARPTQPEQQALPGSAPEPSRKPRRAPVDHSEGLDDEIPF